MAWPTELKEAESPLCEILRWMVRRPGMYLGERPLERFAGWIDGYLSALDVAGREDPVLQALAVGDFDAFVASRLKLPNAYAGETAVKMVAYVSPSQGRGAFQDYIDLLDEFLAERGVHRTEPYLSTLVRDLRTTPKKRK